MYSDDYLIRNAYAMNIIYMEIRNKGMGDFSRLTLLILHVKELLRVFQKIKCFDGNLKN